MTPQSLGQRLATAAERFDLEYAEEQRKAAECRADVQQFFSHDTSQTRRQLVDALRTRAMVIESELKSEHLLALPRR